MSCNILYDFQPQILISKRKKQIKQLIEYNDNKNKDKIERDINRRIERKIFLLFGFVDECDVAAKGFRATVPTPVPVPGPF